jgi:putative redox protein
MKARVQWVDGMAFMGETESGHALVMDGAPDIGGRNIGPRPTELVLLGLGGCTSIDVVMILQKQRQPVRDCIIEVSAERADTHPKVFTKIHVHFIVKGAGLDPKAVERAVNLSADKYCSVSHMLNKTAKITHDFEIVGE